MRRAWHLGQSAIPNLIDTLELHGIKVFTTSFDGEQKVDGLWAKVNTKPVVVIRDKDCPGDRQRLTLAHELGHLALKGRLSKDLDEEKACNRFAGAFLVPKEVVFAILGKERTWVEPRELQLLKEEWGLSMAGWMLRARDVKFCPDPSPISCGNTSPLMAGTNASRIRSTKLKSRTGSNNLSIALWQRT